MKMTKLARELRCFLPPETLERPSKTKVKPVPESAWPCLISCLFEPSMVDDEESAPVYRMQLPPVYNVIEVMLIYKTLFICNRSSFRP